jgi:hypothetical protein
MPDLRQVPLIPSILGSPSLYGEARQLPRYRWFSSTRRYSFSFGSWRNVILEQVPYVISGPAGPEGSDPNLNTIHYYSPRHVAGGYSPPLTPSWWSVYHDYAGETSISRLHDSEHDPASFPWVLTYSKFTPQVFQPEPAVPASAFVLYRARSTLSGSEPIEGQTWFMIVPEDLPGIPHIPLRLEHISFELDPITVYPR